MSMIDQPVAADKQDTLSSPLVEGPFEPIDHADTNPGDQVCAVVPQLVIARDEPRGDKGNELSDDVVDAKAEEAEPEPAADRNAELSQAARNRAAAAKAESMGLDPDAGIANPNRDELEENRRRSELAKVNPVTRLAEAIEGGRSESESRVTTDARPENDETGSPDGGTPETDQERYGREERERLEREGGTQS